MHSSSYLAADWRNERLNCSHHGTKVLSSDGRTMNRHLDRATCLSGLKPTATVRWADSGIANPKDKNSNVRFLPQLCVFRWHRPAGELRGGNVQRIVTGSN